MPDSGYGRKGEAAMDANESQQSRFTWYWYHLTWKLDPEDISSGELLTEDPNDIRAKPSIFRDTLTRLETTQV